jgi:SAM-dependent methyltransferase
MAIEHYLKIDEDGYFLNTEGLRIQDPAFGRELFRHFKFDEFSSYTSQYEGQSVYLEPFSMPFVGQGLIAGQHPHLELPYGAQEEIKMDSLRMDVWNRICGLSLRDFPFVLTRSAQYQYLSSLPSHHPAFLPWMIERAEFNQPEAWSQAYLDNNKSWDMGRFHPALPSLLAQLKIPRSRILSLGSGLAHDAAHLASQGHLVTAIDFSPEATAAAKSMYGSQARLTLETQDVFALDETYNQSFDVVFEHCFFQAISPSRRRELVKLWKRLLAPQGHLLALFYVKPTQTGPPYGSTEWEIREFLNADFEFLYWTRWRDSIPGRRGKELVVYAKKRGD